MQKWEYLVVAWDQLYSIGHDKAQEYINGLGENGWELVSVTAFHQTSGTIETTRGVTAGLHPDTGNTHGETYTNMYCKMFFKRPKP